MLRLALVLSLGGISGLVAVAAPATAQSDLALQTIEAPATNTNNSTTTYFSTIVMTRVDLPIAPAADLGEEEDQDFVSVNDTTNGWTAGKGSGHFFPCYVTVGASSSTQLILSVGNEGTFCTNDYVHPADNITVTLYDTSGNSLGSASATAVAKGGPAVVPVVSSVSPQDGPEGGGTTAALRTGTVAINTGSATTPEAFWFGGWTAFSGFYGVATTNFSASGTAGVYNVVPPAYVFGSTTPKNHGVAVFDADSTDGMSDQDCTVEITGCADEYFYTDSYNGSISANFNPALNWSDALKSVSATGSTTCGVGSTSGISGSLSVGGSLSGGPVSLNGGINLSDSNSGIPEAFVANAGLTVTNAVVVSVNLTGGISGCEELGIPDLSIPDVGGLYFVVGGSINASVTLTITIDAGTYSISGGWIPGAAPFATLTESCTDSSGNVTSGCISTELNASLTGTLTVSPLWLQLGPSQANVGAGLTAAAIATAGVTAPPWPPTFSGDGDICVAGHWAAQVNIGSFNANTGGDWLGPYNVYGDGTICPLGPIAATSAVPDAPTALTATPGDTTAALSWSAPSSNGGSAITGYNVFEGTSPGGESATPVNASPIDPGTTNYTVTGLTNGTTYYFTVVAINSVGASSSSNEASATPEAAAGVPSPPLSADASPGDGQATVTWLASSSDGGSAITGYNVFEGTSPGGESATPVNTSPIDPGTTNYTATGLTDGTAALITTGALP